jgi:DNA polymerase-4
MWPLPVRDLFTVGASTAHRLEQAGIMTIGQLAQTELSRVQRLVGEKQGLQIHRFANGIDDTPVSDVPEEAKGFSISTTLEEDVTGRTEACRILLTLADTVSARMRAETAKAWCIGVTIRSNDFRDRAHQRTLDAPTDITDEIYEVSCRLFDELWDRRTPRRLIGIALTQITREETEQLSLFDSPDRERARKRDRAVDVLRGKFGPETIRRGTALEQPMNAGQKYKAQLEQKKMSRIK